MEDKKLNEKFDKILEDYLISACNRLNFNINDCYWIDKDFFDKDTIPVSCICDYFITFYDLKYFVDNLVDKEIFFSWIEYCSNISYISEKLKIPTLKQFVNRKIKILSNEEIKDLYCDKKSLEDSIENFNNKIQEINKNIKIK